LTKLQTAVEKALEKDYDSPNIAMLPDVPASSTLENAVSSSRYVTQQRENRIEKRHETGVSLGRDIATNQQVTLSQKDRRTGMYIIGANGTGKSTLLEHLIGQDIEQGVGLCLLDPHGDLINAVLNRIPQQRIDAGDVILLNPLDTSHPFGLNLFECPDIDNMEYFQHAVNQVMQVFKKLWGPGSENSSWGPQLEDLLLNITITLVENQGYTLAHIPRLLRNEAFRKQLVSTLRNQQVKDFWEYEYNPLTLKDQREISSSTLNKVRSFTTNPLICNIVGQSHTTVSFRKIMDEGKILLVQLPGRLEELTTLIGSMIIGQLLTAALSRIDLAKDDRRYFNLYADEYQRFATANFAILLTESRKFGIATTIAHQARYQPGMNDANRAVIGQVGSIVVYRVSSEDAYELSASFDCKPPPAIKPPPVIPSNVLDHLNRHQHQAVREFYENVVARLEVAERKNATYKRRDGAIFAEHDFGEGLVSYNLNTIVEVRPLLNTLFYEALAKDWVNTKVKFEILRLMASYLGFSTYYNVHYVASAQSDPQGVEGELFLLDAAIARHQAHVATDQAFLAFLAQNGYTSKAEEERRNTQWKIERALEMFGERVLPNFSLTGLNGQTPKAIWESMKKQVKENTALLAINTLEKILAIKRAEIQAKLNRSIEQREELARKLAPFKYAKEAGKKHAMFDKRLHYILLDGEKWRWSAHRPRLLSSRYTPNLLSLPYTGEPTTDTTNVVCYRESAFGCPKASSNDCVCYGTPNSPLYKLCQNIVGWDERICKLREYLRSDAGRESVASYGMGSPCPPQYYTEFLLKLAEACAHLATLNTPEQVLAANKAAYIQSEIQPRKAKREKLLLKLEQHKRGTGGEIELFAKENSAYTEEQAEDKYMQEKDSHDRFKDCLDTVLDILMQTDGKIEVPSTKWQETILVQQQVADRRNEIANDLVNPQTMKVGMARVRIPSDSKDQKKSEYLLQVPIARSWQRVDEKRKKVVEYTRVHYCKARSEVEKEIRQRLEGEDQLSTKRKHTLNMSNNRKTESYPLGRS
jgi:hypothetical protein